MIRRTRVLEIIALLPLGAFLLGYVLFPIVTGIIASLSVEGKFSLTRYQELFGPGSSSLFESIINSTVVSFITVSLSALLGIFIAFVLLQLSQRTRTIAVLVSVLPLAMPPLVGVIALLFVFGEGGIVPRGIAMLLGLDRPLFYLEGFLAIVAVHTYAFHVYFILFVSTALQKLDASRIEAAESLGASPLNVFRNIVLPHLRPALLGASLLTFMSSMTSFSAPLIFGGDKHFLTTLIYATKLNGDVDLAAAQAALLMVVSATFFAAMMFSRDRGREESVGKGVSRYGVQKLSRAPRKAVVTLLAILLLLELLPPTAILLISFAREGSWTWQLLPGEYTLENYSRLFGDPSVFRPIANSVLMGCLTVLVTCVVGVSSAYAMSHGVLTRVRKVMDMVLSLPFSIPGTVIGLYLIIAFGGPTFMAGGAVLIGTFWIMPLAYVIRTYPIVLRSTCSSLDRIDGSLIEAAEGLGAGALSRLRRIILPLIAPGVISGALLVLILALGEFVSSILLYTPSNRPISVEILSQLRGYNFGSAAAYSVFLLVLVLALTFLSNRLARGDESAEISGFNF